MAEREPRGDAIGKTQQRKKNRKTREKKTAGQQEGRRNGATQPRRQEARRQIQQIRDAANTGMTYPAEEYRGFAGETEQRINANKDARRGNITGKRRDSENRKCGIG